MIISLKQQEFSHQLEGMREELEASELMGYSEATKRLIKELSLVTPPPASQPVKFNKWQKQVDHLKTEKNKQWQKTIEDLYTLYQHANQSALPCMVIGNGELQRSQHELLNFGTVSTHRPACSKHWVSLLPEENKGAIYSDQPWTELANYIFLLGSIHAEKTVYLWKEERSLLWNREKNELTGTGKEIAALISSGYQQVTPDHLRKDFGPTLVCTDKDKAHSILLRDIIRAVKETTEEEISTSLRFVEEEATSSLSS